MDQQYISPETSISRSVHDCASILKRKISTHDGTREEFAQYMGQWPGCRDLNNWQRGRILNGHFADTEEDVTTDPLPSSFMKQTRDVLLWQHRAWWRWMTIASITIAICLFVLYMLTDLHKQKWVLPLAIFIASCALIMWVWKTIRLYGLGGLGQKTAHLWSSPYQEFNEEEEALRQQMGQEPFYNSGLDNGPYNEPYDG